MAINLTTNSEMAAMVSTAYEKRFLERPNQNYVIRAQADVKKTMGPAEGKFVQFSRYAPMTPNTTPLTEGQGRELKKLTTDKITVTPKEYGDGFEVSTLLAATTIDANFKEAIEVLRENMHATLDLVALAAMKADFSAEVLGTPLTVKAAKRLAYLLDKLKAYRHKDGLYHMLVGPSATYALKNDPEWIDANKYVDTKHLQDGELGVVHGIKFISSTLIEDGETDTFTSVLLGQHAFGAVDWSKDQPGLYYDGRRIRSGRPIDLETGDKSDPMGRKHTLTWAGIDAPTVLNSNWGIVITSLPYSESGTSTSGDIGGTSGSSDTSGSSGSNTPSEPTVTYTAVENPTGNPSELGYYELSGSDYVLTTDTTVDDQKTYYAASTS